MVKNKDMQFFYGEFENEQKKEREFEPKIFCKFPAHDLNFHGRWGRRDQIKTSFYKS